MEKPVGTSAEVLPLSGVEETLQRLSLARRNLAEAPAAEKETRPFYKWGTVEQGSYSAAITCSCTHVPGNSPL